jgi:hypothetical protein
MKLQIATKVLYGMAGYATCYKVIDPINHLLYLDGAFACTSQNNVRKSDTYFCREKAPAFLLRPILHRHVYWETKERDV